jgi:hypothetical protein
MGRRWCWARASRPKGRQTFCMETCFLPALPRIVRTATAPTPTRCTEKTSERETKETERKMSRFPTGRSRDRLIRWQGGSGHGSKPGCRPASAWLAACSALLQWCNGRTAVPPSAWLCTRAQKKSGRGTGPPPGARASHRTRAARLGGGMVHWQSPPCRRGGAASERKGQLSPAATTARPQIFSVLHRRAAPANAAGAGQGPRTHLPLWKLLQGL